MNCVLKLFIFLCADLRHKCQNRTNKLNDRQPRTATKTKLIKKKLLKKIIEKNIIFSFAHLIGPKNHMPANKYIFRITLTSCAVCEELLRLVVVVHRIQKQNCYRKREKGARSVDFSLFRFFDFSIFLAVFYSIRLSDERMYFSIRCFRGCKIATNKSRKALV